MAHLTQVIIIIIACESRLIMHCRGLQLYARPDGSIFSEKPADCAGIVINYNHCNGVAHSGWDDPWRGKFATSVDLYCSDFDISRSIHSEVQITEQ